MKLELGIDCLYNRNNQSGVRDCCLILIFKSELGTESLIGVFNLEFPALSGGHMRHDAYSPLGRRTFRKRGKAISKTNTRAKPG